MKPILHFTFSIALLCTYTALLSSCGNNSQPSQNAALDTLTAGTPRKGVIWDKKNIVDIPLTWEGNNMKGNVKSVKYISYKLSQQNGELIKELDTKGFNTYNNNGYLTDQTEYHSDGSPKWKLVYKYDDENKPTEWHFKFHDRNDEYTTTFKYDENGNNIEQVITNTDPNRSEVMLLRYDNMGNEIQEITLDANGMMKRATISNYDDLGDQTMYINLSTGGDTTFQLTATYDDNGYKTGGDIYISGKRVTKWQQKNDNKGRMIEKDEYNAAGKFVRKTIQTYDSYGNILKTITNKADDAIDKSSLNNFHEYEYDSTGNILKKFRYDLSSGEPVPVYLIENTYTYY